VRSARCGFTVLASTASIHRFGAVRNCPVGTGGFVNRTSRDAPRSACSRRRLPPGRGAPNEIDHGRSSRRGATDRQTGSVGHRHARTSDSILHAIVRVLQQAFGASSVKDLLPGPKDRILQNRRDRAACVLHAVGFLDVQVGRDIVITRSCRVQERRDRSRMHRKRFDEDFQREPMWSRAASVIRRSAVR